MTDDRFADGFECKAARCPVCKKLLFKHYGLAPPARIEIKCPRCQAVVKLDLSANPLDSAG